MYLETHVLGNELHFSGDLLGKLSGGCDDESLGVVEVGIDELQDAY